MRVQAIHAWPDNWKVSGADFMTQWINCHITATASLGKPLLLEEVGLGFCNYAPSTSVTQKLER